MNKKTWLLALLTFFVAFSTLTVSCKKSEDEDEQDEWFRDSDFTGKSRNGATGFTIGSNGYLTTGYDGTNFRVDSWKFNPSTGAWTSIANFIGQGRYGAANFVIGNKAYVGTGIVGSKKYANDFYEYNTETDTWKKIADFPGDELYGAIAFSLNGKGYVGCGYSEENDWLKAFYEYDPTTDKWEEISFPGSKRVYGFSFVIGNTAYIGGGTNNSEYPKDFYKFDGTNWTKLNDLNRNDNSYTYDVTRQNASTFVINNLGYVALGAKGSVLNTIWQYNPSTDVWDNDIQLFQGSARDGAVSFSINNSGYITTGKSGSVRFDDTWKFVPIN